MAETQNKRNGEEQEQPATETVTEGDVTLTVDKEPNELTGIKRVAVARELPINSSSTYPGREEDLKATDMKMNTVVDLARRAKFAGSQVPARVAEAGLLSADGQVNIDDMEQEARSEREIATFDDTRPAVGGAITPNPEPTDDQKRTSAEQKRALK